MEYLTHRKYILLLVISFSCFYYVSCDTQTSERRSDSDSLAIQSDSLQIADTIDKEGLIDTSLMARIITPGIYHSDEVWENADKESCFGIFKNNNDYKLKKTFIRTTRVNDPIVDDSTQKTGWEVSVDDKGTPILLISGLDYLTEQRIESVIIKKKSLLPGEYFNFKYKNTDYSIFATGKSNKYSDYIEVINYKLFIRSRKDGSESTDEIVSVPICSPDMIEIRFVGDIDGDNKVDLFLEQLIENNVKSKVLFLSKPAPVNKLLKKVGHHISMGC